MVETTIRETCDDREDRRRQARRERYRLRRVLWQVSKSRTLLGCGRGTRSDLVGVHAVPDGDHVRGTVTGLVSCSSVWSCPVCSAHIRQERANEVEAAAVQHLNAGGGLLMLTLTLRHHQGQGLDQLLDGLLDGWRRTIRGNPWKRRVERHGVVGQIRATEVTHGTNGWHPHLHVLVFTDAPLPDDERHDFEGWLHARWSRFITDHGLGMPSREHGVRLQVVREGGIGQYLAKVQDGAGTSRSVGLEMARGDLKSGRGSRLPFEILDDASTGEVSALHLWWEYERATKGRRCMTWSRGLRDLFDLGDERSDDEITAESDVGPDTLVCELPARTWHRLCRAGLDALLLDAVEVDGVDGVHRVVQIADERLGLR